MVVVQPGHVYNLRTLDGVIVQQLRFVNREYGTHAPGTQTQEVLRALIDRTQHCHNCLPHEVNAKIIYHLRMALVLHEARALERKVEKGLLKPEQIVTDEDGHFKLTLPVDYKVQGS